eukprot:6483338-Amphidinium_carterae.1
MLQLRYFHAGMRQHAAEGDSVSFWGERTRFFAVLSKFNPGTSWTPQTQACQNRSRQPSPLFGQVSVSFSLEYSGLSVWTLFVSTSAP